MRKAKEVLMNKVDTVESNVHKKQEEMQKQLHETTNKLKDKDKEISRLKDELTGQVRHLQADLKEAYSKVQALQETKDIQEQLTIDAQKHTETIETQATQLQVLSVENSDLKSVITDVKEDLKNAKEFLKTLSQENEQEASRLRMESEQTISDLQQQLTTAEFEIKTLNENITSSEKRLENEVLRADEAVTRADDAVKEADDAVNQVATLTEKLEMTENMMNENLKALSTKYQLLEEDYTACQQDRQQETEQLRFELDAVYSTSSEIEAERDTLLEGNRQIMDSVEKEREVGIRLQEQLMAAEQRIETTKEQHEEYKEQMENDLLVLREAKNSLLILSCELKEKVKSLEKENQLLHKDLSRHAETFGEITREKTVLLNKMSDLSIQKQNLIESKEQLIKDSEVQQEQLKQLQEHSEKMTKEKELAVESKLEQEKEMSQQIRDAEDELKQVKQEFAKRLVATQTRCSSKEVEVERLIHQVKSLEETLQTTTNERLNLQELLEKEKTTLNIKITQLEHNHLSEISHYDERINTLCGNLKQSQEINEELELKGKEMEKQLSGKIHELEDNNRRLEQEFKENHAMMQTRCTMAENETQRLNQQVHTLEQNIANAMHERNQIQLSASEREQENTALCRKIAELEEVLDSKELEHQHQQKILQDKLNSIEKMLEEAEKRKQMIEIEMQARIKEMKEEIFTLNENYEKNIATMQEECANKEFDMNRLEERVSHLEESVETEARRAKHLEEDNRQLRDERCCLSNKVDHLEARNSSLENTIETRSSRVQLLTNEQQELKKVMSDLEEKNSALSITISGLQEAAENHVCNKENTEVLKEEISRWQTLYENLEEKVAPFKEQLDQFELERKFMLSKSSQAQSEIQKLSQDYAKLLGHQNSKQKIQHVQKLKEENLALKQEVTKLREQNVKYMRQLKGAGEKNPSKRRFNPSEAFKNTKENTVPLGPHN
ncbi:hyaluronan mediated motility receptor-like [Anneissia japonica]|uniref:hyaluronan mediated motility receptor-like n=1 Tax=Anneissia japonica TaxID=1529436 RepID=UPI0014257804|nr:hyaluronan mediated motility receptor-like [Anneissia japonica]